MKLNKTKQNKTKKIYKPFAIDWPFFFLSSNSWCAMMYVTSIIIYMIEPTQKSAEELLLICTKAPDFAFISPCHCQCTVVRKSERERERVRQIIIIMPLKSNITNIICFVAHRKHKTQSCTALFCAWWRFPIDWNVLL